MSSSIKGQSRYTENIVFVVAFKIKTKITLFHLLLLKFDLVLSFPGEDFSQILGQLTTDRFH